MSLGQKPKYQFLGAKAPLEPAYVRESVSYSKVSNIGFSRFLKFITVIESTCKKQARDT
jgi:hypothetical protein